jgi:hypothetical protein
MELKTNPDLHPPLNESSTHYLLKLVASKYLKDKKNCKFIAKEVYVGDEKNPYLNSKYRTTKQITDVIGMTVRGRKKRRTAFNIEVKVSKEDFKAGYTLAGDYNYIMAPKNVLTRDDMPPKVGLVEVDLDKLNFELDGVQSIKNATKMHEEVVKFRNNYYKQSYYNFLESQVIGSLTNEIIYNNPWFYQDVDIKKGG